ncbi:ABC transporter permease [Phyllobacterium sp. 21LDTY02-6]|uniref:ABC transporter permease n=1 Tax=unclassified Phyllobacterium TaxID=2638441 RepID=UPI002020B814|nr:MULTISPECIES: ABC transporter permease [unclassified Phyllobacterium]MCO4317923.1 ABC transporter permease [Phyllobacterium sp. 21LDTY02-6]MCX8282104.1 ABC transporter permease [Phyllobacterium sp. 0TCS1.6C]MCX8296312.1 ABC transporter permease [Phyllobacterium sp. 0TCS1.6A]
MQHDTPPPAPFLRKLLDSPELMIFGSLILIIVIFMIMAPAAFLSGINLRNMAIEASMMMILAVGMTYVIVTSGIDLSVGAVLVFSSVVSVITMRATGSDAAWVPVLGLVVSLLSGAAWGLINGILIARARLTPLIVTLATMGVALGLARLLTGGIDLTGVPRSIVNSIGIGRIGGIPVIVLIACIFAIIGGVVLHMTRFGLYTYAIGSNEQGARRAGVKLQRHLIIVYVISGLCAGLAGYLTLARFSSTTISGHSMDNLKAITAVVLGGASLFGGIGSMYGTAAGVFIPVVLASGLIIVGLPSFWQEVAVGMVLLAAVLLDQYRRRSRSS